MITIRPFEQGDEPAVRQIREAAVATLRRTYRPKPGIRPAADADGSVRFVAIWDDLPVGTLVCQQVDDRLHLMGLAVAPACRRCGVARAMVEAMATLACERGQRSLSLYTVRETGNVAVFERLGFSVVRESVAQWAESDQHKVLTDTYMERDG